VFLYYVNILLSFKNIAKLELIYLKVVEHSTLLYHLEAWYLFTQLNIYRGEYVVNGLFGIGKQTFSAKYH